MPHVDRAGQIRQYAPNDPTDMSIHLQKAPVNEEQSDLSSEAEPDENDGDDVDSDGFDEDVIMAVEGDMATSLSQQHDFVGF